MKVTPQQYHDTWQKFVVSAKYFIPERLDCVAKQGGELCCFHGIEHTPTLCMIEINRVEKQNLSRKLKCVSICAAHSMGVEKYGSSEVCRGCSSRTEILAILAKRLAARRIAKWLVQHRPHRDAGE